MDDQHSPARYLDWIVRHLIAIVYATIIIAMGLQVFFRYVIGASLPWTEELARYLFIWLCFLGGYTALVAGAHVGVDYLTSRFSRDLSYWISLCVGVMAIIALAFLVFFGVESTMQNHRARWWTIDGFRMSYAHAAIPVGAALMIVGYGRVILSIIRERRAT